MSDWCRVTILPIVVVGVCALRGCDADTRAWPYWVEMNGVRLNVEVAVRPEQLERGLMFRDRLDDDWGMLFVYDVEERLHFWMRNTSIPLSIAFLDRGRVVRDVQDMQPMSEATHTSAVPTMYALEANQGWFRRHDVKAGTTVTFSPEVEKLVGQAR